LRPTTGQGKAMEEKVKQKAQEWKSKTAAKAARALAEEKQAKQAQEKASKQIERANKAKAESKQKAKAAKRRVENARKEEHRRTRQMMQEMEKIAKTPMGGARVELEQKKKATTVNEQSAKEKNQKANAVSAKMKKLDSEKDGKEAAAKKAAAKAKARKNQAAEATSKIVVQKSVGGKVMLCFPMLDTCIQTKDVPN